MVFQCSYWSGIDVLYSPVLSYWLALNHGPAVLLLGFIEELGQDAAPPVPPAEGPFHHADDDPFDHLGQVVDHLHGIKTSSYLGAWSS